MYHIPKNLSSNVNLLYCMNLWTLESKIDVGHFSNDPEGHFEVIQVKITKIFTFFFIFMQLLLQNCIKMAPFIQVLFYLVISISCFHRTVFH